MGEFIVSLLADLTVLFIYFIVKYLIKAFK